MVVAASASDFDHSGGQRLTFVAPMGPPRPPPATRAATDHLPMQPWAAGPQKAGQQLRVTARGFQPGEPLLVAICGSAFVSRGDVYSCKPRDEAAAYGALMFRAVSGVRDAADAGGAYTTVVKVPARSRSVDGTITTCAKAPGACSIVVTAAADTKRSGVLPLTVRP